MNHIDFHRALPSQIYSEVEQGRKVLEDIASVDVTMLRAPFGHFRWELKKTDPSKTISCIGMLLRHGRKVMRTAWPVGALTDRRQVQSFSFMMGSWALIGMFSTAVGTASAAAVSRLVPELREKGLRFEILSRGLSSVN